MSLVVPMPWGSRPSIAALTRSSARKASDIECVAPLTSFDFDFGVPGARPSDLFGEAARSSKHRPQGSKWSGDRVNSDDSNFSFALGVGCASTDGAGGDHLSFPKTPSGQIRAMTQNQRIIRRDARDPPSAHDVCALAH